MRVTDERLAKLMDAFNKSEGVEWNEHETLPNDWWFAHSLKISREAIPDLIADLQEARAEIERLRMERNHAQGYVDELAEMMFGEEGES
ncbi:hypothetical protein [Alicyclobacillus suci]|uniref:hypothetical protein n=1 Tax=Alicyclobacillus suci TaxID=2816080 RepID=UPI001A8E2D82|nr:hypothetical protein [Alicyclobacillus suci]